MERLEDIAAAKALRDAAFGKELLANRQAALKDLTGLDFAAGAAPEKAGRPTDNLLTEPLLQAASQGLLHIALAGDGFQVGTGHKDLPRSAPGPIAPLRFALPRTKLGLALAGGGFRASLFHLGVLRRLAELDLLRHVEVISTVSGGSIIGALYGLLLKASLDEKADLPKETYAQIVEECQRILVRGIQKNLRTLLFCNPLGILSSMVFGSTLSKQMARLYENHIYSDAVKKLLPREPGPHDGRFRLHELRFTPGKTEIQGGLENYNADVKHLSKVPSIILNATALNSGAPFRFSSNEIGDPRLGYFRYDEIVRHLLPVKHLLDDVDDAALGKALEAAGDDPVVVGGLSNTRLRVFTAAWWRNHRHGKGITTKSMAPYDIGGFPGHLQDAEFGLLRQAKLAAWYLRIGVHLKPQVTGGVPEQFHREAFWSALWDMDRSLALDLNRRVLGSTSLFDRLLEAVIELYYARSAEMMSWDIFKDWTELGLGDAVGASACFPPIFPPFMIYGLYDDRSVTRLGLTDGGVYDNIGIAALLDEGCTHIIASDTGGPFDLEKRVSVGRIGMSERVIEIARETAADLQRAALKHRVASIFHISSERLEMPGMNPTLDPAALARMRTDLDGFGDIEVAALIDHGYETADQYLRRDLKGTPYASPDWRPATKRPIPMLASQDRIDETVRAGSWRFFRALRLRAPGSWAFTLTVAGLAIGLTWDLRVSAQQIAQWLARAALHSAGWIIDWVFPKWAESEGRLGVLLLLAIPVFIAMRWGWPWCIEYFKYRYPIPTRKAITIVKRIRRYSLNALWLLGLMPIWIALGSMVVAGISYGFYYYPFLWKTRNEP